MLRPHPGWLDGHVRLCLGTALGLLLGAAALAQDRPEKPGKPMPRLTLEHLKKPGRFRIEIDGELFSEYRYGDQRVPILYPVIGAKGLPITRNYPMRDVAGEARDHPHHRSLWFAHGEVNGHDFWHGKDCRVVYDKSVVKQGRNAASLTVDNSWLVGKKRICRERRVITFHVQPEGRFIDYEIRLTASEGGLHFGDTKEGSMAIRTVPALRLRGKLARGQARNAAGQSGRSIWGQRAGWVDYFGPVQGQVVGVAIFDHPSNHGFPCRWHARDYGLVAANPWGVGPFEKRKKGPGQHLKKGESVTLKYRFFFHAGDTDQAMVAAQFARFAKLAPAGKAAESNRVKKPPKRR